jgi:spore germination protein
MPRRLNLRISPLLCLALLMQSDSPQTPKPKSPIVLAFYRQELKPLVPWAQLTHLAVFHVRVNPNGGLDNTTFWRSEEAKSLVDQAHRAGAKVLLTAANLTHEECHALLQDQAARENAIEALIQEALVTQRGDGLILDFEAMHAEEREPFARFAAALAEKLHQRHPDALFMVLLPPINWVGAYDEEALGTAADYLILMTYNYSWRTSDPGPVAPLPNVKKTIERYLSIISPSSKVLLGLPVYGYDYPSSSGERGAKRREDVGPVRTVRYAEPALFAEKVGAKLLWDVQSQSPWFVYSLDGVPHQVWYEDQKSAALKLDLVSLYGLAGVSVWNLGFEDSSFWEVVAEGLGR